MKISGDTAAKAIPQPLDLERLAFQAAQLQALAHHNEGVALSIEKIMRHVEISRLAAR